MMVRRLTYGELRQENQQLRESLALVREELADLSVSHMGGNNIDPKLKDKIKRMSSPVSKSTYN